MRPVYFMLALAMTACSATASAADVEFEVDSHVFEQEEARPLRFEIEGQERYEHPIYEGLWPTTLEAFRGIDCPAEVLRLDFAFPDAPASDAGMALASNNSISLRKSLWKATREEFEEFGGSLRFRGECVHAVADRSQDNSAWPPTRTY